MVIMANDQDLVKKTKKTCEKISENLYIIANEPSLACYRLQEHVHKSTPILLEKRNEMKKLQKNLQGNYYDLDYSIGAIKSMDGCEKYFKSVEDSLKNAVFLKQQLDYEENVRLRVAAASGNSPVANKTLATASVGKKPFHRFSGSFDLPSSLFPSSIASVSSSASADLKDLKSMISQITSGSSPASSRNRTGSLSTPTSHHTQASAKSRETSETAENTGE